MARVFAIFAIALICCTTSIRAQDNTDTNVAPSLYECYNNTELLDANMKLPMSMNILIDLIRKVENGPDRMDLRMLAVQLLHRFRQDGIRRASNVKSAVALPFSPTGHENDKFKIVLRDLVPGNAYSFPNETLTPLERCVIHAMLSESIELRERGDESSVCNRMGRYKVRIARSAQSSSNDEVEIIEPKLLEGITKNKGNIQQNPNKDVDMIPKSNFNPNQNNQVSQCPLEYGVVYTKWGAVGAGNLIAGIAAGAEPQNVQVRNIVPNARADYVVDNVWGATLAGNLAEAGYLASGNGDEISVGNDGGWPSTIIPHGYYLSSSQNLYMTDAEIRGDLDGLILGTRMKEYRNNARDLKLSQLLDMYYSERGVFGENIKACRRRELLTEFAPTEVMQTQARSFGNILNKKVKVQVSMNDEAVEESVNKAVDLLSTYIPQMNDLRCRNEESNFQTTGTDLIILLDCEFPFEVIQSAFAYFLDNADINPYDSNYTIINANDGSLIMNSSNSILEFHETFTEEMYQKLSRGFDLTIAVNEMEAIARRKMEDERKTPDVGGRSLIGLFVSNNIAIEDSKKQRVIDRINDILRIQIPDLKLLALTSGAKEMFENIVKDTSRDVFVMSNSNDGSNIMSSIVPLIKRIQEVPRRLIDSKCGSDWQDNGSSKPLTQYITPTGINYYRIHPNYFFGDAERKVKVRGQGNGATLNVCYSRDIEQPRGTKTANNSSDESEITCKQITSNEHVIELNNPCSDKSYISDCSPFYMSVESTQKTQSGQTNICTEKGCRFTDNIKYTITLDNFGCYSSAGFAAINTFILICMLCIAFIRNN